MPRCGFGICNCVWKVVAGLTVLIVCTSCVVAPTTSAAVGVRQENTGFFSFTLIYTKRHLGSPLHQQVYGQKHYTKRDNTKAAVSTRKQIVDNPLGGCWGDHVYIWHLVSLESLVVLALINCLIYLQIESACVCVCARCFRDAGSWWGHVSSRNEVSGHCRLNLPPSPVK